MTYGDFPQEIQEIIKQRVEEAGNVYDKSTLSEQGDSNNGFTWSDSLEGDTFWRKILINQDLETFYQKYPKTKDSKGFTEPPVDVKKGDKFVYVSHIRIDETERMEKLEIGQIVVFDKKVPFHSDKAYFEWNGHSESLDWGFMDYYKEPKKDYFEVGDTVEVINVKDWESKVKLGHIFVIQDFGKLRTCEAFNNEKQFAHFNDNHYGINWTPGMLKIVSKGNTKGVEGKTLISNNKINKDGSKSSNQGSSSPIVFGFTINLERGSPVRGEVITSTNKKIAVGN